MFWWELTTKEWWWLDLSLIRCVDAEDRPLFHTTTNVSFCFLLSAHGSVKGLTCAKSETFHCGCTSSKVVIAFRFSRSSVSNYDRCGVFPMEPFRGTDQIKDGACSSRQIWLVSVKDTSVLILRTLCIPSPLFHPSASVPRSCVSEALGHCNFHTWLAHRQQSAETAE